MFAPLLELIGIVRTPGGPKFVVFRKRFSMLMFAPLLADIMLDWGIRRLHCRYTLFLRNWGLKGNLRVSRSGAKPDSPLEHVCGYPFRCKHHSWTRPSENEPAFGLVGGSSPVFLARGWVRVCPQRNQAPIHSCLVSLGVPAAAAQERIFPFFSFFIAPPRGRARAKISIFFILHRPPAAAQERIFQFFSFFTAPSRPRKIHGYWNWGMKNGMNNDPSRLTQQINNNASMTSHKACQDSYGSV